MPCLFMMMASSSNSEELAEAFSASNHREYRKASSTTSESEVSAVGSKYIGARLLANNNVRT